MGYKPLHDRFDVDMLAGRWEPYQYDEHCAFEYATFRTYTRMYRPIRDAVTNMKLLKMLDYGRR
jgi:hypothetical protein